MLHNISFSDPMFMLKHELFKSWPISDLVTVFLVNIWSVPVVLKCIMGTATLLSQSGLILFAHK